MGRAKSVPTPMNEKIDDLSFSVPSDKGRAKLSHISYRQIIGSLFYLGSHTSLDTRFSVSTLSRFVSDPKYGALECRATNTPLWSCFGITRDHDRR